MTLYEIRRLIEKHEHVKELIDFRDIYKGEIYFLIKVNDKYIADTLSGADSDLKGYIEYLKINYLPIGIRINFDVC